MQVDSCFIELKEVNGIALPQKFTFPFYYIPHPLSILAANRLMQFLEKDAIDFGWEFGLRNLEKTPRGRMFGVLVVKTTDNVIGFLAAFSGNTKLKDKGFPFVPAVYDFWQEDGFYLNGIKTFEQLSEEIQELENSEKLKDLKTARSNFIKQSEIELTEFKKTIENAKKSRDEMRSNIHFTTLDSKQRISLLEQLNKESTDLSYAFKRLKKEWRSKIELLEIQISDLLQRIKDKTEERKTLSNHLQETIYKGFQFLNINGDSKGLLEIFENTVLKQPPSGAGECAAPRLLQHAFNMNYQPLCMAEFWWGESSKDELRIHRQFYPACRGKCQPILSHMLSGIEIEENPLLSETNKGSEIQIVYEDEFLLLINKPEGLLSVPGKELHDSVFSRIQILYPNAFGPLVVHRLDMDTSGLMLIAKNLEIYKLLQAQFIRRKIKKRYTALLDGVIEKDSGKIELPLKSDFLNRPRQKVSFEEGKKALTLFEVIERKNGRTLLYFYPTTGRTHQLRVHAAHEKGLNCPILGDDLYGKKDRRLYLHAAEIGFEHPVTKQWLVFNKEADFQS